MFCPGQYLLEIYPVLRLGKKVIYPDFRKKNYPGLSKQNSPVL
jgi:hypothetical protein